MYCKNCGKFINDGAKFCPGCGAPVNQVPTTPQPNQQQPYQPAYAPQPVVGKGNGVGIAAFILGLLSIYGGIYFCIIPIIGLIVSIVGTVQKKKCSKWNGFATAGLVINIIFVVVWGIVWAAIGGLVIEFIGLV